MPAENKVNPSTGSSNPMTDTSCPTGLQSHSPTGDDLIKLPKAKPNKTGAPSKAPFYESLSYIIQEPDPYEALKQFRIFLAVKARWTQDQIETYLDRMADKFPALVRSITSHQLYGTKDVIWFSLPQEPTYDDYGGFFLNDLPQLRAAYYHWQQQLEFLRKTQVEIRKAEAEAQAATEKAQAEAQGAARKVEAEAKKARATAIKAKNLPLAGKRKKKSTDWGKIA